MPLLQKYTTYIHTFVIFDDGNSLPRQYVDQLVNAHKNAIGVLGESDISLPMQIF